MSAYSNISNFVAYSMAIDENKNLKRISQFALFNRGVSDDIQIVEALLELIPMK
jgi:hypothetical protein